MRARIFAQIDGGYDAHLLRPPFGSLNKTVRRACKTADAASIRWSVDTRDWSNKNPRTILKIVKAETKDGAIILFHDRLDTTVTALEEAIPWLQAQGYDLVTVTELIESSGQSIRYGEDYQHKPGK
jgi:peptidoglycan/xylan/chitin deacetylase (PgdA/CDA1 family)